MWSATIPDDPVKGTNARGTLSFAATGEPNSRSTHMFINLVDNARLDGMGFAPVGNVISGMSTVDKIYAGYGEQPDQELIASQGNVYLIARIPEARLHQNGENSPIGNDVREEAIRGIG